MDFGDKEDNDEIGVSKINSAGLVNSTITNQFNEFFRHYVNGEYLSAHAHLDCIWSILGGEKKVKGSAEEKQYFSIEEQIAKTGRLSNKVETIGFGIISKEQMETLSKQARLLVAESRFLHYLQNIQGKGTAYNDGDDEEAE